MNDIEKVCNAFRNCITEPKCRNCPWEQCNTIKNKKVEIPIDLALEVNNLLFDYMKEKVVKTIICECCGLEHPADDRKCQRCGTAVKRE